MDKVRAEELPHFWSVPGYRGCRFMTRETTADATSGGGGGAVEILVVTFWDSMEAVRAFAGEDPTRAHLPPEIMATLERYDEEVNALRGRNRRCGPRIGLLLRRVPCYPPLRREARLGRVANCFVPAAAGRLAESAIPRQRHP